MARAPWASDAVYEAAAQFRDRCLRINGSLFTDRRLWTAEALQAIDARVSLSDIGSGSWLDKLEAQLEVLDADEILLGAELVFMLLLPQLDTTGKTKREQMAQVLRLVPAAPAIPERLSSALGSGVANFSTAKAWSPALLRFIIHLAVATKELPEPDRDRVLSDAQAFSAVVAEVRTSTDQMMANAIKHELFPDSFESIISPTQRDELLNVFGSLAEVAGETDVDRKIARIVQLAATASDGEFNLYDDVFKRVWSNPREPRWLEGIRLAKNLYARDDFDAEERTYKLELGELVGHARSALLAGEPGWPELLSSALKDRHQNLVGWRVRDAFRDWVIADVDRSATALRKLWDGKEPDVRGFLTEFPQLPQLTGQGTRASITSFLLMGVNARRFPFFKPTVHGDLRRALGLPKVQTLPELEPDAVYRPAELAARLGIAADRVRAFLRERYLASGPESDEAWALAPEQAEAVLTEFGAEADATSADGLYADWVALLRELRYRMLAAGTQLRDLLDAQGLAWWLVSAYPPKGWSGQEVAALEAFARGTSPEPEPMPPPSEPVGLAVVPAISAELDDVYMPVSWLARLVDMLNAKKQEILYGPPGTGKTFVAQRLGRYIASHGGGYRLVQFHPSYTYEDFFEGYRPRLAKGGALSFDLVKGALREIAADARANPSAPYLLVIDEINRGNLAKIFGELYFLLEYRDEAIQLQYSRDEMFALPGNLFLIGTMNTADRSIALVDSALRRRFRFLELSPTKPPVDSVLERWLGAHDHDPTAAVLLRALNEAIDDEDFSIGPSYFMQRDGTVPDLDLLWAAEIMPLLRERYYGTRKELERFELDSLRKRLDADAD